MSILAHLSEAYDAASIALYDLRMLVHSAVLEYIVLDPKSRVVAFKSFPNSDRSLLPSFLEATRRNDPILRAKGFRSVTCYTPAPSWLLLPNAHFQPNTGEYLLEQVCDYEASFHNTRHSAVTEAGLHISFALDIDLEEVCRRAFTAEAVDHLLAELIRKGLRILKASGASVLGWVHLTYDSFFYLLFKNNQLVFCNQYAMFAAEDVVYFVLRVNMALQLESQQISGLLTGNSPLNRTIGEAVANYFGSMIAIDSLFDLRLPPDLAANTCLHLLPESIL